MSMLVKDEEFEHKIEEQVRLFEYRELTTSHAIDFQKYVSATTILRIWIV